MKQRQDAGQDPGGFFYNIDYKGKPIILTSQLGLRLGGAASLITNFEIIHISRCEKRSSWKPVYGELSEIPDNFNQMKVHLRESIMPFRLLNIIFRAYDEGIAFCYELPQQNGLDQFVISEELSHFHFPTGTTAWANYNRMQTEYQRTPIEKIKSDVARPVTLEYSAGFYAALAEANVQDYSNIYFSPVQHHKNIWVTILPGAVLGQTPFLSPWRVMIVGDQPGDLLEKNYLISNLCPPNQLSGTEWIKPGKMMREMTLSTSGGKTNVDFAVAHGLDYILYDGGWYGDPIVDYSMADQGNPWKNKIRNIPDHQGLDIETVSKYANDKGIGIFLYLDRRVVERQLDRLLPLYKSWGIKGLKFGFVNWDSQAWNKWLYQQVKKCADYEIMVDVHDEQYPTGLSRTYPNLLTMEGVLGNEAMPDADHNVNLALTRLIAGPADYTPSYYQRKEFTGKDKEIKNTAAHQLALPVIFYSPLQSLFWYDRPEDYQNEPEIQFWEEIPTTWDKTNVLKAHLGEYVVIARKKGSEWFVGGINNTEPRTITFDMTFLDPLVNYDAILYTDGDKVPGRTGVQVKHLKIKNQQQISLKLKASGGFALHIKSIKSK